MARITVEDCLAKVPNRFTLVLVAAERAKQLLKGSSTLIEDDRENKEVVTSLREIAAGVVAPDLADFDENVLKYSLQPIRADDNELPPEAGDLPPEVEAAPPAVEEAPPAAEEAPPEVEEAPPAAEEAPAAAEEAPAAAEEATPEVEEASVEAQDPSPEAHEELPTELGQ